MMFKGLIGRKVGMTQVFDDDGVARPVTVIEAGPCYVTQIKTVEKDGYSSVQIGFDEVKPKRLTRGQLGHLERNDLPPLKVLREFKTKTPDVAEGDKLTVDVFNAGERVDVVGTSKGRGFAGVVKRYHFGGGPKTHGQSDRWRAPGSLGSGTTPGRVFKGKRGPGRMGNERVTSSNVRVALVDPERNLLAVDGSVPGPKGGMVVIKPARKE
jgi:large subunit ribosomal protein L3